MAGSGENAPLLGSGTPTSAGGESSYYFLNQGDLNHQGGTTEAVRDSDGGQVVEGIPHGSNADEFAPRVIGASSKKVCASTSKHVSIGFSYSLHEDVVVDGIARICCSREIPCNCIFSILQKLFCCLPTA